jgi:hypothetical protein
MKNAVFCNMMTPCGSCMNRRFREIYCFHLQGERLCALFVLCEDEPLVGRGREPFGMVPPTTYWTKQWVVNNNSTVTNRHDCGGVVAGGSLHRPSWGATSQRTRRTQSFFNLKINAIRSSETSVLTKVTWRDIPEGGILYPFILDCIVVIAIMAGDWQIKMDDG